MDFGDIIYLLVLIFSICFGKYINKAPDVDKKQKASTLAGFVIVCVVSGFQLVYPVVLVAVISLFILRLRRLSHIFTFAFSFTFLTVLRYYQCLSGHVNLILMMLTLKLIGLSFELHDNRKLLAEINSYDGDWDHGENLKYLLLPHSEMCLTNIVHYSFCYVGVLTGPYYKYQTYLDWCNPRINLPSNLKLVSVLSRLKFLPLYATVFLVLSHFYPVQYVLSESFHSSHSCFYRWLYSVPVFFTFKLRLYVGLLLSEAVAVMVGLGSYPSFTQSRAGQGPTTSVIAFRKIAIGESESHQWTADFCTVQSVSVKSAETEPSLRRTIKLWNSTVQFWMSQFVYKRVGDTRLRLYVVFFISALWHGLHSGYYLSLCYMPLYLYIEDLYIRKVRACLPGKLWSTCVDAVLLLMKTLTLASLAMCFTLLNLSPIFHYFTSLYFLPCIVHVLMYLAGKEVVRQVEARRSVDNNMININMLKYNILNNNMVNNNKVPDVSFVSGNGLTLNNNNECPCQNVSPSPSQEKLNKSLLYSLINIKSS